MRTEFAIFKQSWNSEGDYEYISVDTEPVKPVPPYDPQQARKVRVADPHSFHPDPDPAF